MYVESNKAALGLVGVVTSAHLQWFLPLPRSGQGDVESNKAALGLVGVVTTAHLQWFLASPRGGQGDVEGNKTGLLNLHKNLSVTMRSIPLSYDIQKAS